jgi:hypothetical protein
VRRRTFDVEPVLREILGEHGRRGRPQAGEQRGQLARIGADPGGPLEGAERHEAVVPRVDGLELPLVDGDGFHDPDERRRGLDRPGSEELRDAGPAVAEDPEAVAACEADAPRSEGDVSGQPDVAGPRGGRDGIRNRRRLGIRAHEAGAHEAAATRVIDLEPFALRSVDGESRPARHAADRVALRRIADVQA